jgi:hypothetical protein
VEWQPIATTEAQVQPIYELYDYAADPAEQRNLAADQPGVVETLVRLLEQHPAPRPQVRSAGSQNTKTKSGTKSATGNNQNRGVMFERRDIDQDGKLSKEEFLKGQSDPEMAPARFTKFDVNQDGFLSRNEFVSSGAKP